MKKLSLLILLALLSCKEVSYKEPQPKGIKALAAPPSKLLGLYLLENDRGDHDTLVINKKGFFAKSEPKEFYGISDSVVMKSYANYYFISKRENPEWLLRAIQQEKNGDISFYAMEYGEDFQGFLKKLSKDIPIDSSMVNDRHLYQIDPSPKQLIELLGKPYFTKLTMKKVKLSDL